MGLYVQALNLPYGFTLIFNPVAFFIYFHISNPLNEGIPHLVAKFYVDSWIIH